jgi:regulator of sigma E protease
MIHALPDLLRAVLGFVLAVGVLVTFHEAGHFVAARCFGVHVLRFSIGFGRPLWCRTSRRGTEWVIATIPLGGYVKLLDEREGPVPSALGQATLNRRPVWQRLLIVLAGPAANAILAVLLCWLMFMVGTQGLAPRLGTVAPDSPAARAGLRQGDEIIAVGHVSTRTWGQVTLALLWQALRREEAELAVSSAVPMAPERQVSLPLEMQRIEDGGQGLLAHLGLQPALPAIPPVVGQVMRQGPASGILQPGDRIVALDGQPIRSWEELAELVRHKGSAMADVAYERQGTLHRDRIRIGQRVEAGRAFGFLGLAAAPPSAAAMAAYVVRDRRAPLPALLASWDWTVVMGGATAVLLAKTVEGQASAHQIGGPVTIAVSAGQSLSGGPGAFLQFMALLSLSLALLNVLPIPMLDGGHALFYVIEGIKGSPLSDRAHLIAQQVGMLVLLALLALALYNDLSRLFS